MKKSILFLASFLICLAFLSFKKSASCLPSPEVEMNSTLLMERLIASVENVKTLKYELKITERIKGVFKHYGSKIKLQCSPRKIYIYVKGAEVLWIEGKNNGDALVNPGSFPYVNLNLNPYGSLMTNEQHHTIHQIGFEYFKSIIEYTMMQVGDKFSSCFLYGGEEMVNNKAAYKMTILINDFAYVPYIIKKNENLISIARKLRISEYMIKENNPTIKSYSDVKENQEILVPNTYAKMTVIYIDKIHFVPLLTRVYDDKGLFESYEYLNLEINPAIANEEFTKDYKDYHF